MNGWISVFDQTPAVDENVLVCTEKGRVGIAYMDNYSDISNNWVWDGIEPTIAYGIFYWMPLPEPPEVVDE